MQGARPGRGDRFVERLGGELVLDDRIPFGDRSSVPLLRFGDKYLHIARRWSTRAASRSRSRRALPSSSRSTTSRVAPRRSTPARPRSRRRPRRGRLRDPGGRLPPLAGRHPLRADPDHRPRVPEARVTIRVGVVGSRRRGAHGPPARLSVERRFDVVGVADTDPASPRRRRPRFESAGVRERRRAARRGGADAVVVATPPQSHVALGEELLRRQVRADGEAARPHPRRVPRARRRGARRRRDARGRAREALPPHARAGRRAARPRRDR